MRDQLLRRESERPSDSPAQRHAFVADSRFSTEQPCKLHQGHEDLLALNERFISERDGLIVEKKLNCLCWRKLHASAKHNERTDKSATYPADGSSST